MENCGVLAESYRNSFPFVSNVMGISLAIFAPITVLLNALLMASFIATKQVYLNTSNFLIVCLSLSDFLNGAVTMSFLASILYKIDLKKSCDIFNTVQITSGFFATLSSILTVLIAVDRYLNMNPHLGRSSRCVKVFKMPNIYFLVTIIAIAILTYSVTSTYAITLDVNSMLFAWLMFINSLMVMLGSCAVAILYAKAYIRIRHFTDTSPIYKERNGNITRPQYVHSLYKSVLVLVIFMMLIYVPFCCAQLAVSINILIGSKDFMVVHSCFNLAGNLLFLNCIINSVVILWFNKTAKRWVLANIRCTLLDGRNENINSVKDAVIVGSDCERSGGITLTCIKPNSSL